MDTESGWHGIKVHQHWLLKPDSYKVRTDLPIFKDKSGKRLMLPKEQQINPDKIIRYLNIKATVLIEDSSITSKNAAQDAYYK
jgi:hypothetical protein